MDKPIELPWQDPLAFAPLLDNEQYAALLYSGADDKNQAHYSYICLGAEDVVTGDELAALKEKLSRNKQWYDNFWVGWLGYGLKNQLELLPEDSDAPIQTDDVAVFKPRSIYRFDHQQQSVICIGEHVLEIHWNTSPALQTAPFSIAELFSNMTHEEYLAHVETILEHIRAGTIYQANLTRKFFGTFNAAAQASHLFTELCRTSPASYSAFIRMDGVSVISSSPELFLRIDEQRNISTRPIKGTISRGDTAQNDEKQKTQLANSEKDRAENLMIVDLMRNDLSRVCETGSVEVSALFDITTHAHIHHMSSLVTGTLTANIDAVDAIKACFPPGSMTGAPKIKAMEICSTLERQARGIYSGALGWFAGDGTTHTSVVIRTLICKGNQFEFQAGGGIVADSIPEKELTETIDKTRGICQILGISETQMRSL